MNKEIKDVIKIIKQQQKEEKYLFEIARAVLEWAGVEVEEEDLAQLVTLELLNIKKYKY